MVTEFHLALGVLTGGGRRGPAGVLEVLSQCGWCLLRHRPAQGWHAVGVIVTHGNAATFTPFIAYTSVLKRFENERKTEVFI